LETYQKKNLYFICDSPTSMESSSQDEEAKVGLNGAARDKEV
jgi:hypothetical protein